MESSAAFTQLLDKYLTQTITAEEQQLFFELVQSKKYLQELEAVIDQALCDAAFDVAEDPLLREKLFDQILQQRETPVRRIPLYRRWGWAAALLVLLGGSIYFFTTTGKNEKNNIVQDQHNKKDILPGTNRAMLTLSDGTVITLDSAANGAIAQQGNASVVKLANGELRYETNGVAQHKVMMNTMVTPKGGQYQLTLPDGTKIWLNAASSITYPAVFAGNERSIKVSGEVYMEIAKDARRPFLVDVDGRSTVQVLGTSFNINSYTDEGIIRTTLVEGSVKVKAAHSRRNQQAVTLKPGQQAVITSNSDEIRLQPANIDQVLAWKNGFINFESGSFQEVMRQIERWYDIDVKFEGAKPPVSIEGRMDRGVKLSDLMGLLNNFGIHARLEGRTLILSEN
ncbi:MAG: FecR family protein [Pseudobacter sp.]|uniref:FecR family protein n=1 Tax=Pseudobacter sp. TaxID=2045420 RepID=UPI003F8156E3